MTHDNSLFRKLKALSRGEDVPMHMPGHKRNLDAFPRLGELGAAFDITEIDGFDNLHSPQGAIADICDRAAEFFGAKRSFLSVNGSTGAILAAIYATTQRGDKVLIARNCHRSVYNAIAAFDLQADFLMPAVDCETGLCGGIRPEDVAKKCASNKYAAVIVTSPTYEGVTSDIRSISRIVRDCGSVLIADEAHGAHFATSPAFPESAAVQGADIVVSGIHKTLPALTQTSFLHLCSDRVPEKNLRRAMSLFVTSSPSYILMSSVDVMLDVLAKDEDKLAENLVASLENFYEKTRGLRHLSVLRDQLSAEGVIYRKDISKIYIDCTKSSLRGFDLKNRLREKHGIVVEYASRDGVLLIFLVTSPARIAACRRKKRFTAEYRRGSRALRARRGKNRRGKRLRLSPRHTRSGARRDGQCRHRRISCTSRKKRGRRVDGIRHPDGIRFGAENACFRQSVTSSLLVAVDKTISKIYNN